MTDHHNQLTSLLYKRFSQRLRQFILSRIPDNDEAEDILHEVFLKIHDKIESLKNNEKIESWIYQVTRNTIIDHYRKKKEEHREHDRADIPDQPDELTAEEQLALGMHVFVDQLPEPYREAIVKVEYEGVSQKELAREVGISLSGAKSRVQRARAMLRDLLMKCCHFEFDQYGTIIDYHPISCSCCAEKTAA
jgi:RNA polymerase sigma-70 factor (ECF subfamily)